MSRTEILNKNMKATILFSLILISLLVYPVECLPQKRPENRLAIEMVKSFYRFHFSHENNFNKRQVALRRMFLTPRLHQFFEAELKRESDYLKKYPDNKPYFEGLPFQPIELCPNDYSVKTAQVNRNQAIVKVNFIYSKSNCKAKDGTLISYKILLSKISEKWLIDNLVYDDGSDLISDFKKARKIK